MSVTNINDNTPTFGQSVYSASVAEDQSSGTSVSQLAAADGDVTSSLSYVISAGNAASKFAFRLGRVVFFLRKYKFVTEKKKLHSNILIENDRCTTLINIGNNSATTQTPNTNKIKHIFHYHGKSLLTHISCNLVSVSKVLLHPHLRVTVYSVGCVLNP